MFFYTKFLDETQLLLHVCLTCVEVQFGHLKCVGLTVSPAETEHDDRLQLPLHDHLDHLEAVGASLSPSLASSASVPPSSTKLRHGLLEVIFTEIALVKTQKEELSWICTYMYWHYLPKHVMTFRYAEVTQQLINKM